MLDKKEKKKKGGEKKHEKFEMIWWKCDRMVWGVKNTTNYHMHMEPNR